MSSRFDPRFHRLHIWFAEFFIKIRDAGSIPDYVSFFIYFKWVYFALYTFFCTWLALYNTFFVTSSMYYLMQTFFFVVFFFNYYYFLYWLNFFHIFFSRTTPMQSAQDTRESFVGRWGAYGRSGESTEGGPFLGWGGRQKIRWGAPNTTKNLAFRSLAHSLVRCSNFFAECCVVVVIFFFINEFLLQVNRKTTAKLKRVLLLFYLVFFCCWDHGTENWQKKT